MKTIKRQLLENLIFGKGVSRRFTQDSNILPDVWIEYGEKLCDQVDLLLTPYRSTTPGQLALLLEERLEIERGKKSWEKLHDNISAKADLVYNQSTVVAKLYFDELIRVILPLTPWWNRYVWNTYGQNIDSYLADPSFKSRIIQALTELASNPDPSARTTQPKILPEFVWLIKIAGTISYACRNEFTDDIINLPPPVAYEYFADLMSELEEIKSANPVLVFSVSRNRPAETTMWRSTMAIKADAARRVFQISCKDLCWAVIDSGIDAKHPAFALRDENDGEILRPAFVAQGNRMKNQTRVVATYNFVRIRELLRTIRTSELHQPPGSPVQPLVPGTPPPPAAPPGQPITSPTPLVLPSQPPALPVQPAPPTSPPTGTTSASQAQPPVLAGQPPTPQAGVNMADPHIQSLRAALQRGGNIDWDLLEPLLRVPHDNEYVSPLHEHGTHVAGILAGDWRKGEITTDDEEEMVGVCPDLKLYDLRVLDDEGKGDEFSVMAALQFVRHLNAHKEFTVIHGVNLSISIQHDVANYACGYTPVCEECERLVDSGVVVVTAAGNKGYLHYMTPDGSTEGYRSISVTDPGNAEGVITVGSTHAFKPHIYGVSYFSSRGPTGDGRMKPDLVAPGEKITSPVPGETAKRKDGTSMAAPHVSGAAALLMARHKELVGRPQRVKQILCKTATDLGRDRYFQGFGMVDILRALQSV